MFLVIILYSLTCAYVCQVAYADSQQQLNERVIRQVFGPYGSQAVSVAWCESRLSTWASNGQYVNLFQMGYEERKRFGWHTAGSSPWTAAKAAYRYFVASGYSWGPWTCKP